MPSFTTHSEYRRPRIVRGAFAWVRRLRAALRVLLDASPRLVPAAGLLPAVVLLAVAARGGPPVPPNNPDAIVDLATPGGLALLQAEWRTCDAQIVEVDCAANAPSTCQPGAAGLQAAGLPGEPKRTHDVVPRAGAADFDDSHWARLEPDKLESRRGGGRLSFVWYRIALTIPERAGDFDARGSTAVLEITLDDYAEIWVDGALPQVIGQSGGGLIAGWNTPNRLVLARDVRPGQRIQLAIFAANGPLSEPPANFVWIRSATLDFYRPERFSAARPAALEVVRLDAALDALVPPDAPLERVADGFGFAEGPVWIPAAVGGAGARPIGDGYLLLSDPNRNNIYRVTRDGDVSVYRAKSGYRGVDVARYRQPGSNGLALDGEGRLTICEHGNRRVTRIERNGSLTVLADRYEDRRLNSPNDLAYRSDGALFFSDPAFGLPGGADDPAREQEHMGVYCLKEGVLRQIVGDLNGPNGVALSPDEQRLYVGNWDEKRKVVMRYDLAADGRAANPAVLLDLGDEPGDEAIDGLKVDERGNVYVSGPGGVWVVSADGRRLGVLKCPQLPANFAWGDADGRTLYLAARSGVYRLRMSVAGAGRGGFTQTSRATSSFPLRRAWSGR